MNATIESRQKGILILGAGGQLGSALRTSLSSHENLVAIKHPQVDYTKRDTILAAIEQNNPGLIVNAAAYTAVDQAEEEEEIAQQVNGDSVGYLAAIALHYKIGLIHFSTDYVFDGKKGVEYSETDVPSPLGAYGSSKLSGEQKIQQIGGGYLIFRTSWVYSMKHDCFVTKVLHWSRQNEQLRIVDDQISNPTWATMLAGIIGEIIRKGKGDWYNYFMQYHGIYHLSGKGHISRLGWAKEILKMDPHKDEQVVTSLESADSSEFPTLAQRPLFSALNCTKFEKTFDIQIPNWKESLTQAMGFNGLR